MNTHELARQLIWLWRQFIEAQSKNRRSKATTVALARFEGACEAAHAVGYGQTAANVSGIVRNTLCYSTNTDASTRTWLRPEVIEELADRLAAT